MFPEQQNSAADLSMLVLESLEKSGAKIDDETLGEFNENHIMLVIVILPNTVQFEVWLYFTLYVVRAEFSEYSGCLFIVRLKQMF